MAFTSPFLSSTAGKMTPYASFGQAAPEFSWSPLLGYSNGATLGMYAGSATFPQLSLEDMPSPSSTTSGSSSNKAMMPLTDPVLQLPAWCSEDQSLSDVDETVIVAATPTMSSPAPVRTLRRTGKLGGSSGTLGARRRSSNKAGAGCMPASPDFEGCGGALDVGETRSRFVDPYLFPTPANRPLRQYVSAPELTSESNQAAQHYRTAATGITTSSSSMDDLWVELGWTAGNNSGGGAGGGGGSALRSVRAAEVMKTPTPSQQQHLNEQRSSVFLPSYVGSASLASSMSANAALATATSGLTLGSATASDIGSSLYRRRMQARDGSLPSPTPISTSTQQPRHLSQLATVGGDGSPQQPQAQRRFLDRAATLLPHGINTMTPTQMPRSSTTMDLPTHGGVSNRQWEELQRLQLQQAAMASDHRLASTLFESFAQPDAQQMEQPAAGLVGGNWWNEYAAEGSENRTVQTQQAQAPHYLFYSGVGGPQAPTLGGGSPALGYTSLHPADASPSSSLAARRQSSALTASGNRRRRKESTQQSATQRQYSQPSQLTEGSIDSNRPAFVHPSASVPLLPVYLPSTTDDWIPSTPPRGQFAPLQKLTTLAPSAVAGPSTQGLGLTLSGAVGTAPAPKASKKHKSTPNLRTSPPALSIGTGLSQQKATPSKASTASAATSSRKIAGTRRVQSHKDLRKAAKNSSISPPLPNAAAASFSFVNYGIEDAQELCSAVAPSGSYKVPLKGYGGPAAAAAATSTGSGSAGPAASPTNISPTQRSPTTKIGGGGGLPHKAPSTVALKNKHRPHVPVDPSRWIEETGEDSEDDSGDEEEEEAEDESAGKKKIKSEVGSTPQRKKMKSEVGSTPQGKTLTSYASSSSLKTTRGKKVTA